MNAEVSSPDPIRPEDDSASGPVYTLEIIAGLAGVNVQGVLRYQELGLIEPAAGEEATAARFDTESLRRLRQIQYVCDTYEVNEDGLKLILGLLEEVERLRGERRRL